MGSKNQMAMIKSIPPSQGFVANTDGLQVPLFSNIHMVSGCSRGQHRGSLCKVADGLHFCTCEHIRMI